MKKKSYWRLKMDIPDTNAKKGMIFEWCPEEDSYITKELPWMFTPMLPYYMITKKCFFERLSSFPTLTEDMTKKQLEQKDERYINRW